MTTALFSHPDFLLHDNGAHHPERAARLDAIESRLKVESLWDGLLHPDFAPAREAQLEYSHTPALVNQIKDLARNGGGQIDADTRVNDVSFDVAKLAVGASIGAVAGVLRMDFDNAFVASRPPGHHAESARAMGFCLFNSIAIAARYAQKEHGLERVAIVDFDVHHGNGTQEIFYSDGSVFFASVHQSPLYPGTGRSSERGAGDGEGVTLNIPLEAGHGDAEYSQVWDEVGREVKKFAPELILVSAGFDAHARDPLGGMNLSAQGYANMMRSTLAWANEVCDGRVVCVLEGGYDLKGLSESVEMVIRVLSGENN